MKISKNTTPPKPAQKPKKALERKAPNLAQQADKLGAEYDAAAEGAKSFNTEKDRLAGVIKTIAAAEGTNLDGRKVVQGKHYVVGYTIVNGTPVYDHEAAKKLAPSLLAKFTKIVPVPATTTVVFDAEAFAKLCQSGAITQAQALEILKAPTATNRVYVARVKADDDGSQA